ncbi:MAG TPA: magnesium/cobalt transporter CorA [Chitinophagaceae bacterium]|nr:magnesium/cobalt transporter CorA [Chitinophagaceae bacterium]
MKISKRKYLDYLNPLELLKTKKVLQHNPTISGLTKTSHSSVLSLFEYTEDEVILNSSVQSSDIVPSLFKSNKNYWLNLDILNAETIEEIGISIGLHQLIIEDILSKNQRPKIDEIDNLFTCVLHMLYFNQETKSVESEQVSFVLGPNYLISFQDDCVRDLFNPIREKLKIAITKVRQQGPDYLLYALLDAIVDHYFTVLDNLAVQIEKLEEEITRGSAENYSMNQINDLRKEIMFFRRNANPVREMINGIIRSETPLIQERNTKYFKDILDHIIQANDLCDTYRDVISNIRDLYLSQMNLKMNEVMKFLAIVTTILAPATVIGGIFGMNFDRIPYLHHQNGFWIAGALMIIIPIIMIFYFRKKNWF